MLIAAELAIISGPLQWKKLENILCFKGENEIISRFKEEEILNTSSKLRKTLRPKKEDCKVPL